jgi:tetratricopeptide (TPR) repeat protein
MAKLPSLEDTALAFAEVYMTISYLTEKVGWEGIRRIVAELRDGRTDAEAVSRVVGTSFGEFQARWRKWLEAKKLKERPGLHASALKFKRSGKEKEDADARDDTQAIPEERARKFARIGGMMRAHHRLVAAALEYEKAQAIVGASSPEIGSKLARTYFELGQADKAIAAAEPVEKLYPDQAGPLATLGESWLLRGDLGKAEGYLRGAIAVSPFDPALHCGLVEVYRAKSDARLADEENACRTLRAE